MPKSGVCTPVAAALILAAVEQIANGQSYSPGFTWNRQADWQPGPTPGLPTGNPAPDSQGEGVYSYEWTSGDKLASFSPWFENPGVSLVWDDDWHGTGQKAWTRANDTNPPIFDNRLTHNLIGDNFDFVPALRWINPVFPSTTIDITGKLTVLWSGNNFIGAPTDVDVVISLFDPNPDSPQAILFADTVSKPTPGLTVGDTVELEVDIRNVQLEYFDQVSVSLRGHDELAGEGRWVVLYDHELEFSIIPSPSGIAVLASLGLVGIGRRKRR